MNWDATIKCGHCLGSCRFIGTTAKTTHAPYCDVK